MSYLRKFEYKVVPEGSFKVKRNCSGCGCKATFVNTNNFRVNANGRNLDVWLIYQCEKCKHTYNLSIYDRNKPQAIDEEEYRRFIENSKEAAIEYGRNVSLFSKNKAEIDWRNVEYNFEEVTPIDDRIQFKEGDLLVIYNNSQLKIRADKVLSEILNITRSKVKLLEKSNLIKINENRQKHKVEVEICGAI